MNVSIHNPVKAEVSLFNDGKDAAVKVSDWSGNLQIFGTPAMCEAIAAAINSNLPAKEAAE